MALEFDGSENLSMYFRKAITVSPANGRDQEVSVAKSRVKECILFQYKSHKPMICSAVSYPHELPWESMVGVAGRKNSAYKTWVYQLIFMALRTHHWLVRTRKICHGMHVSNLLSSLGTQTAKH